MCYFSHKDILIKSYFYRKGIQVWKHVSDSNSADYIIPCSKTSLDSITYKVNSEFFIVTFQGLHSLAPNFLPSLSFTTNSLDASQSVILTWSPNILHRPCSRSVRLLPPPPPPASSSRWNSTGFSRCWESSPTTIFPDSWAHFFFQMPVISSNSGSWSNFCCHCCFSKFISTNDLLHLLSCIFAVPSPPQPLLCYNWQIKIVYI